MRVLFFLVAVGCLHATPPKRLVSLAPSITEALFELGLGDRLVGATTYCDYPEAAKTIPRVGGFYNPNFENILIKQPDLVLILTTHTREAERLKALEIPFLICDNTSLNKIIESVTDIGKKCGVESQAAALKKDLSQRRDAVIAKTTNRSRPDVIVSIGRKMGTGALKDLYVAGTSSIYHDLIQMAGGSNTFDKGTTAYHHVSVEGIMAVNPDVIFDMVADMKDFKLTEKDLIKEWQSIGHVTAVEKGAVHVFGEDYVTVPGPRMILLLERMAQALHPDAFTENIP